VSSPRFVDAYLGYLLGQANHAVYRDFEAQVRAAGLRSLEWRVLATLCDSAPLTITQLAQEVLAQQPTVSKQVQRMTEQGWLRVCADAQDQRRTLVQISPAGQGLVQPLMEAARQQEARILHGLGTAQARSLKASLAALSKRGAAGLRT